MNTLVVHVVAVTVVVETVAVVIQTASARQSNPSVVVAATCNLVASLPNKQTNSHDMSLPRDARCCQLSATVATC